MSLDAALRAAIRHAVDEHGGPRAAMLEALKLVQDAHGWVADADLAETAAILGVTTAELDGLATFYSHIFRKPVGERLVLLCDGLSCALAGADAVRDALLARLGIGLGETTRDGRLTLINVCCVGACDKAPVALVGRDRRIEGPLCPGDLDVLVGETR